MKYLLVLCFAYLHINAFSQNEGIEFRGESWNQILDEAKSQNKIIFVDAYTTWCGPCKWMNANVFPEPEVGSMYNENFINVKLDMEKGEGIDFAKQYNVNAFPTLLFINGKGEMVHKSLGARDADKFITLGLEAMDDESNLLGLQKKHNAGNKLPSFLKKYTSTLLSANLDAMSIANEYFETQNDWLSADNKSLIGDLAGFDLDSKYFQFMLENRNAFEEHLGIQRFEQQLDGAIGSKSGRNATLESMTEMYKKYYPDTWERRVAKYTLSKQMYKDDADSQKQFLDGAVAYINKYNISDVTFLNSMAWRVYEITDNPMYLLEAKKWALKSIAGESNFYNNDTAAAIYYALKQKDEALHFAGVAIQLAMKDKMDYSETSALIEKIKLLP